MLLVFGEMREDGVDFGNSDAAGSAGADWRRFVYMVQKSTPYPASRRRIDRAGTRSTGGCWCFSNRGDPTDSTLRNQLKCCTFDVPA